MEEILKKGFAQLGVDISERALEQYMSYYEYLAERNKVMNLTAIIGAEDVARLHFLDCAALLGMYDFKAKRLIDVGTGAGFPGLPLRIAEPSLELTLLDSLNKRVDFLRETCAKLGFEDVTCIHARAEETPAELRGAYDIAVSRAVARLNTLCELCLPFLKVGGVFIAMKGPECAQEVSEARVAMHILGAELRNTIKYTIPGTDVSHAAVIIEKVKPTHPMYPRKWAQIKKRPL